DAIGTAKIPIEQEGEPPVELVVPKGMAEQALAMLGAMPVDPPAASSEEPPPADAPPPATTADAEGEAQEPKMDRAAIAKIVDAAIAKAVPEALEAALRDATHAPRPDRR